MVKASGEGGEVQQLRLMPESAPSIGRLPSLRTQSSKDSLSRVCSAEYHSL